MADEESDGWEKVGDVWSLLKYVDFCQRIFLLGKGDMEGPILLQQLLEGDGICWKLPVIIAATNAVVEVVSNRKGSLLSSESTNYCS